jgi:hypothetical protein
MERVRYGQEIYFCQRAGPICYLYVRSEDVGNLRHAVYRVTDVQALTETELARLNGTFPVQRLPSLRRSLSIDAQELIAQLEAVHRTDLPPMNAYLACTGLVLDTDFTMSLPEDDRPTPPENKEEVMQEVNEAFDRLLASGWTVSEHDVEEDDW